MKGSALRYMGMKAGQADNRSPHLPPLEVGVIGGPLRAVRPGRQEVADAAPDACHGPRSTPEEPGMRILVWMQHAVDASESDQCRGAVRSEVHGHAL